METPEEIKRRKETWQFQKESKESRSRFTMKQNI